MKSDSFKLVARGRRQQWTQKKLKSKKKLDILIYLLSFVKRPVSVFSSCVYFAADCPGHWQTGC